MDELRDVEGPEAGVSGTVADADADADAVVVTGGRRLAAIA
jgi:hypothetical protein